MVYTYFLVTIVIVLTNISEHLALTTSLYQMCLENLFHRSFDWILFSRGEKSRLLDQKLPKFKNVDTPLFTPMNFHRPPPTPFFGAVFAPGLFSYKLILFEKVNIALLFKQIVHILIKIFQKLYIFTHSDFILIWKKKYCLYR